MCLSVCVRERVCVFVYVYRMYVYSICLSVCVSHVCVYLFVCVCVCLCMCVCLCCLWYSVSVFICSQHGTEHEIISCLTIFLVPNNDFLYFLCIFNL